MADSISGSNGKSSLACLMVSNVVVLLERGNDNGNNNNNNFGSLKDFLLHLVPCLGSVILVLGLLPIV